MTGLTQATLWADETLIGEVNVFRTEDKEYVTVVSKTSQKVLFFQPNDALTLHYQQGVHLHKENLVFHEVKMLNRKPYYVFRINRNTQPNASIEPFTAIFSNEIEKGMVFVIEMAQGKLTLRHDKPIQGRFFEVTFKENNQLRHFLGKAVWTKKIDNHYYYQLLSI